MKGEVIENYSRLDWGFLETLARNETVLKEVQKFHTTTMNISWGSIENLEDSSSVSRWIESVIFRDILPKSNEEIIQFEITPRDKVKSPHYFDMDYVINNKELGQLLYDAFGREGALGSKNYPSAGALYPIIPLLLVFNPSSIEGINSPGCYVFNSTDYQLIKIKGWGAKEVEAVTGFINMDSELRSPYCIGYAIDYKRAVTKYLSKGYRHALIEVGLMAQSFRNTLIQNGRFGDRCWSGFADMPLTEACGLNVRLCPITLIQWFGIPKEKYVGD